MSFRPMFPSWHSYGMMASLFMIVRGMPDVHDDTQGPAIVDGDRPHDPLGCNLREALDQSERLRVRVAYALRCVKFVVSTTSVLPSQS